MDGSDTTVQDSTVTQESQGGLTPGGAPEAPVAPATEQPTDPLAGLDEGALLAHPRFQNLLRKEAERRADQRVTQAQKTLEAKWQKEQAERDQRTTAEQQQRWLETASDEDVATYVREGAKLQKAVLAEVERRAPEFVQQGHKQAADEWNQQYINAHLQLLTPDEQVKITAKFPEYAQQGGIPAFVNDVTELIAERKVKAKEPIARKATEEAVRAEAIRGAPSPDVGANRGNVSTGVMTPKEYAALTSAERAEKREQIDAYLRQVNQGG